MYDPAILNGWGVRPYNWEFSAGVQQELLPRMSLSAGTSAASSATSRSRITRSSRRPTTRRTRFQVPVDSRLPNSGQVMSTGLFDVNPNKVGQIQNVITDASHLRNTDRTLGRGRREPRRAVQQALLLGRIGDGTATDRRLRGSREASRSRVYWRVRPGGNPVLPHVGTAADIGQGHGVVQPAVVRHPSQRHAAERAGPVVAANNVYTCAPTGLAGVIGLGRPLSGGTQTVNLVQPNSLYGDRLNQVDLRITKILRFGSKGSVDLDVDIYNAFNSDAILSQQDVYALATWQNATSVIQPRFVKFQVRYDF